MRWCAEFRRAGRGDLMSDALKCLMRWFDGGPDDPTMELPKRALFLGAQAQRELAQSPDVVGWQPLRGLAERWDAAGGRRIEREGDAGGDWPCVIYLPGKSRSEIMGGLARAYDLLADGGELLAAIPNRLGASRIEKEVAKAAGGCESLQKFHCRAFRVRKSGGWDQQAVGEWRAAGERNVSAEDGYVMHAGGFSEAKVDAGSRLLAGLLPKYLKGEAADLGAGGGYLSRELARRCPGLRRIDLYEVDSRALDCARENLAGIEGMSFQFLWHDVTNGLKQAYDTVVMNPPFHAQDKTDIELGRAFVRVALASLKPGGRLWLVANRQLPYEAELAAAALPWRSEAESDGFKVISVMRP